MALEIGNLIDRKINNIAKIMPAVVTKLNDDSVDVEILTRLIDKRTGKYKTVKYLDVPVMFPASYEDAYLRLPVKKGTTGSVYVYDVDISNLIDSGNETAVNAIRTTKHNTSDITFQPDFQTAQKRISIDGNAELRNGSMSVILYPDGKIQIKGASKEVLSVISDFMAKTISNLDLIINDQHILAVPGNAVTHSPVLTGNWSLAVFGLKALMQADKDNLYTMKV
jgi:hypothetical protein